MAVEEELLQEIHDLSDFTDKAEYVVVELVFRRKRGVHRPLGLLLIHEEAEFLSVESLDYQLVFFLLASPPVVDSDEEIFDVYPLEGPLPPDSQILGKLIETPNMLARFS